MQINLKEALEVIETTEGVENVEDLKALGFTILGEAGKANVEATVEQKAELLAMAEALFNAGRRVQQTRSGRTKHILGYEDGIEPYRVVVTKAKS